MACKCFIHIQRPWSKADSDIIRSRKRSSQQRSSDRLGPFVFQTLVGRPAAQPHRLSKPLFCEVDKKLLLSFLAPVSPCYWPLRSFTRNNRPLLGLNKPRNQHRFRAEAGSICPLMGPAQSGGLNIPPTLTLRTPPPTQLRDRKQEQCGFSRIQRAGGGINSSILPSDRRGIPQPT